VISREACKARDRADGLASSRALFRIPEGVIYLDGNSLGVLPQATPARVREVVESQWGNDLIRSWNTHEWVTLPRRVGDKLASFLGARSGEVIVADSTSINVFKLLAGAVRLPDVADRRVILSERGNFPTDLYMAEGLAGLLGEDYELRLIDDEDVTASLTEDVAVAMFTQVDYRSGRVLDMAALNARAREAGTRIVWDLSHSAGALPVKLNRDGADLAVGCGYKYLNGGPGAPAYLYVAKALQSRLRQPLSGWFGHAAPFEFTPDYRPAAGIEQMLVGTPSVIATAALECGVDTLLSADMASVRAKSLELTDLFIALVEQECAAFGFELASPRDKSKRGSQLSFRHPQAYAVMQAIIDRGVIGDFRKPDLLRFGFTPLYIGYADVWDAVAILRDVMEKEAWQDDRHRSRKAVT
jgi:kynureninase